MTPFAHLPWREPARPHAFVKDKAGERWGDLIDRLARGFERPVADAFRAAAATLGDRASIQQLAAAIAAGDVEGVVALLGLPQGAAPFDGVLPPLQLAAQAAGQASLAMPSVSGATRAVLSFDLLNPHTSAFLRDYGFRLVSQITEEVRQGIREAVKAGVEAGEGPAVTARAVKQVAGFGLTKQQARAVHNYRRELENLDAAALDRVLRDKRFDPALKAAIKAAAEGKPGLSPEQIEKMVNRYAERMLRHRAMTIARTESLRAANMGTWLAMRQAVENGSIPESAVRRFYLVAKDERVCPQCRPVPRLNRVGVGLRQPFQTPIGAMMLPPIHVGCRCTVTYRLDRSAMLAASA